MSSSAVISAVGTKEICYNLTQHMNSRGVLYSLGKLKSQDYLSNSLPLLELQMCVILMVTHMFYFLLNRIGLRSMFVSSMLAGMLIGPSFLGRCDFMREYVFPANSQFTVHVLSLMGLHMFLFLTAVKMEIEVLRKARKKEILLGISSVAVPFLLGLAYKNLLSKDRASVQDVAVIREQSLTHFPVISYLVNQLKISNSELGRLVLSSALVSDIFSFVTAVSACLAFGGAKGCNVRDISGVVLIVIFAAFVLRPCLVWMIRKTPRGKPINVYCSCIVAAMFFLLGWFYVYFRNSSLVAPFIFGFAVPSGPPIGSYLVDRFEAITIGVLLPIEIATAVMRADFFEIIPILAGELWYFVGVLLFLFAVKWTACVVPPLLFKMPLKDSFALAFILSAKGIIELSSYAMLRDSSDISIAVYSLVTLYILFNSTISRLFAKYLYNPSKKYESCHSRNIEILKPESILGVLAIIHRPEDIASIHRVTDTIHPTKESPVTLYVLHLIELAGRSTPVFISHDKNKPASEHEHSQNVVAHFDQYEKENLEGISVNTFTAISPPDLMDEDVCSLALEKLPSLIIIPLHGLWSNNKTITDSSSVNSKNLVISVLQKAPCSVGFFLDRSKLGYQPMKATKGSFHSVCVIFVGGNDDREALSLGIRMARSNSNTSLIVVHLVHQSNSVNWVESAERVLDGRALKKVSKASGLNSRIEYRTQEVKDGPETALLVRTLVDEYDLFIVGRRYGNECPQTKGLSEWSEFPEIGDIGDLLTSKDLKSGASVLIVQQQKLNK